MLVHLVAEWLLLHQHCYSEYNSVNKNESRTNLLYCKEVLGHPLYQYLGGAAYTMDGTVVVGAVFFPFSSAENLKKTCYIDVLDWTSMVLVVSWWF